MKIIKIKNIVTCFVTLTLGVGRMMAQNVVPPIPVELTIGNNNFGLQTVITRNLPESKKFSFLSVSVVQSDYENNIQSLDFVNNSQISYNFYKGLGISAGLNTTKNTGMSPQAGLQYVLANQNILLVLSSSYQFNQSNSVSLLSIFEYKPKISEKLRLYSRIQGFYTEGLKNRDHERSYVQLRLGLGLKGYQSGLFSNLDYYGPNKVFKDNYGVFFRINI